MVRGSTLERDKVYWPTTSSMAPKRLDISLEAAKIPNVDYVGEIVHPLVIAPDEHKYSEAVQTVYQAKVEEQDWGELTSK